VTEKFDEMVAKFLGSLEDITAKLAGPLEAASRRSGDAITEATKTVGETLGASARQLEAETDKLSIRAGAIAITLEQVVAKLRGMQTPDRVIEVRLEPITDSLTQSVDRFSAQSGGQAAAIKVALQEANAATKESIEMIATAREELAATAARNRAALEATSKAIAGVAQILDEFKTSSHDYVEVLRLLLEKTDGTMRTFTDVLVKSGVETATQTDWLREVLPAIEANAQTLVTAADRISRALEDLRARRSSPERETID
jgi:hypothetical protein